MGAPNFFSRNEKVALPFPLPFPSLAIRDTNPPLPSFFLFPVAKWASLLLSFFFSLFPEMCASQRSGRSFPLLACPAACTLYGQRTHLGWYFFAKCRKCKKLPPSPHRRSITGCSSLSLLPFFPSLPRELQVASLFFFFPLPTGPSPFPSPPEKGDRVIAVSPFFSFLPGRRHRHHSSNVRPSPSPPRSEPRAFPFPSLTFCCSGGARAGCIKSFRWAPLLWFGDP